MKKKTKRNVIILIYGFIGGVDVSLLITDFNVWYLIPLVIWASGLYFILQLKKWM